MNNSKDGDILYYNATLRYEENTNGYILAKYDDRRIKSILHKPEEYYMSIDRFKLPGNGLPLAICDIQEGQTNPNLTPYSVTLTYSGSDYQTYLVYTQRNFTVPVPGDPTNGREQSEYYWIYSYQQILNMFNTALSTSFTALKAAYPAAPMTESPYFIYDPETTLISLIAQYTWSSTVGAEVYINHETLKWIDGIQMILRDFNNVDGKDFEIAIEDIQNNAYAKPGSTIPTLPTPPAYLEIKQEFPNPSNWTAIDTVIFETISIPVRQEDIFSNESIEGAKNYRSIITDFAPSVQRSGDSRTEYVYNTSGFRRLMILDAGTPLKRIDFNVSFSDKDGLIWPIKLYYGQILTVKFAFIKKSKSDSFN